MAKRKTPAWAVFPEGALISLGIYIALQCLLAMLTVKAMIPESAGFRIQMVCAVLAAFCGGLFTVRRASSLGTLWAALISTATFVVVLLMGAILIYDGVNWSGQSATLLACILAGGILAGMAGSKRGKRKGHSQNVNEIGKRKKA